MRAWELLLEDEKTEFDSDLDDLLIAAKANGLTKINVEDLVKQLNDMGHSVTPDSLVDDLDSHEHEHENIKNVTLDTITLKSHTADDEEDTEDESEDETGRIARKAAMKNVKQRKKDIHKAAGELEL